MNVKLNDNVIVITGKDAGKQGKIIATSPKNHTVTVEGVNLHKKAQKARRANEQSQLVDKEQPIDVSNVMIYCSMCGKGVRVKHSEKDGKKVRICARCGEILDAAYAPKGKKAAAETKEAPKKRVRKRSAKKAEAETAESGEQPAENKGE